MIEYWKMFAEIMIVIFMVKLIWDTFKKKEEDKDE